ncbi:uncharacterized protein [Aquarana catesbeiana]|uniref:uncharacterized protein n=1 Tax=Aquarana catesbeiana TaxID=8400 RepID=UPI003CC9E3F9
MMENRSSLTSPDGSSNGNPPKRAPRPLYSRDSTKEGHTIPHRHQSEEIIEIKDDDEEEEERLASGTQQSVEEGPMTMESKQEEPPLYIDINGHYVQNVMKGHQIISQDFKPKGKVLKQYSPKLNRIPENLVYRPRLLQTSAGPRNPGKSSDKSHTMTSEVHLSSRSADRSTSHPKKSSSSQEDAHKGESSFSYSCVVCDHSFTNRSALLAHQKSHFQEGSHSCSECGKSFTTNADLLTHHRVHTGVRPFRCSECGVCYTNKRYLNKHMKVHTGEGAHRCPECGKCFSQKGLLLSHQKVHTG